MQLSTLKCDTVYYGAIFRWTDGVSYPGISGPVTCSKICDQANMPAISWEWATKQCVCVTEPASGELVYERDGWQTYKRC